MSEDTHIHVITLDGKTDVIGPVLPFAPPGTSFEFGGQLFKAGVAPDGHTLAYNTDQGLVIINLEGNNSPQILTGRHTGPGYLQWTLDGHELILNNSDEGLFLIRARDGAISQVPGTPFPTGSLAGGTAMDRWQDATHILLGRLKDDSIGSPYQFYSFDITSGAHHLVANIDFTPNQALGTQVFPDLTKILYFYDTVQQTHDPTVSIYDIASGVSTKLPNLTRIQSQLLGIQNFVWRPGTQTVAFCTGSVVNGDLKDWLADPAHDIVTSLPNIGYPVGWSPDGKTLMFSSNYVSGPGQGPFTITALTFGSDGQTTQTVLTRKAMHFNFIGFIKTAN